MLSPQTHSDGSRRSHMEYAANQPLNVAKFSRDIPPAQVKDWRLLTFSFRDVDHVEDIEKLAKTIYSIFETFEGSLHIEGKDTIKLILKSGLSLVVDDIFYKLRAVVPTDCTYRVGEQGFLGNGIVTLQFVIAPSDREYKKLSSEFISQERVKRNKDIVMLAEDDMYTRSIIKNSLSKKFDVVDIEDGSKVVQTYVSQTPDILFLDIHLPHKSGLDILREIIEVDPHAYVVMISADAIQERILECVKAGAKGFVAKPFRPDKLLEYIRKCPTIRIYC